MTIVPKKLMNNPLLIRTFNSFYFRIAGVLFRGGEVIAVLDIDSERLATFDDTDRHYLERLVALL